MMLAAEKGIPHDPAQHAAYVSSWIKALEEDKNEIFRAASAASAAADYVLGRSRNQEIEAPELAVTGAAPARSIAPEHHRGRVR